MTNLKTAAAKIKSFFTGNRTEDARELRESTRIGKGRNPRVNKGADTQALARELRESTRIGEGRNPSVSKGADTQELARELRESTRNGEGRNPRVSAQRVSKHRHPKRKNEISFKPAGLRFQFVRFVSVLMMMSLLVTSNPAAPKMIAASAGEFGQDVRYSFLSNFGSFEALNQYNPILGLFYKLRGEGTKKQQQIAKIEISPNGKVAIWEGDEIAFAAVARDSRGNIVQSTEFKWSAHEEIPGAQSFSFEGGMFESDDHGFFLVTAESGGVSETIKIRVAKNPKFRALKELQLQDRGIERKSKRPIEADVKAEMARPRSKPIEYSSRMRKSDKKALKAWDKEEKRKRKLDAAQERKDRNERIRLKRSGQLNNRRGSINDKDLGDDKDDEAASDEARYIITPEEKLLEQHESASTKNNSGNLSSKASALSLSDPCWWDPDYPGCEEWEPGGGGSPTPTPTPTPATPTPTPPNDEWNNDNNETADDPAVQPGTPANNGTAGAGSGNFGFSAPVASLPGRNGLNVNLSLNYNSLLWHNDGDGNITYDIDKGSPAPGWDIGFGKILDMDTTGGAMLEGTNGTRHSYAGDTVAGAAGYSTYYGRTTDGSFADYIVSRTPSGITSGTAYFPDGTKATYGAPFDGVIYPTQIKDKHGNYITITYVGNKGPNINTITDTMGRVITFKYQSGRLISVKGPGYNGTTQTYVRLHYTQKTLSATFSGLTKGVRNASPYQIDSIFYPVTNTGYWFKDSDSYSSYGMIKKVMMNRNMTSSGTDTSQGNVTKGTMSSQTIYNYPASASNLTSAPKYTNKTDSWYGSDTGTAVTSYSVANTANPRTTTVTLPNGTKSKTYSYNNTSWNNGMLYKTEFLASNNAVLSRQDVTWVQGYNGAPRVTQILATDEKNQTSKQTLTYGTYYNQIAWKYEYGYSNNLLRRSYTTYNNTSTYRGTYSGSKWMSGRHLFNLPLTTEVRDHANVRQSRINFTYDVGALTARSSVPNYDTAYNTLKRGNVTSTRTYTKASNLTGYIDYFYTYDVLGNNITATTNCCQQITTTYNSTYKYAYPASVRRGLPTGSVDYNTSSATYDFNTGAIKTSKDYNNRTTTAAYDTIGRPAQVTLSTGGKTIYEYFPNTLTTKQTSKMSNNVVVSQSTSIVNGRGQPQTSKLLTGTSTETATRAKYDDMGRRTHVSNPYPATSSPTKWTTYTYDNQSRVTQVKAPDNSTSKTFYNETTKPSSALSTVGSTVRSQDAWGRERWARSDDWGRLVEVVEPKDTGTGSATATGNMVTRYEYDAVDELTKITQGSQIREFKYDSLGRMLAQKLAEQSASINDSGTYVGASGSGRKWSDYFTYDTRSNLTQRMDSRGVKTNFVFNNDPLNRLKSINFDKGGADTTHGTIHEAPNITYSYMTSGDKERISTVSSAGVSTEYYTYDVEGRVSNYKMSMTGRTSYPFETSYLYDTANRLTEVRYPKQYGMSGNPRKTVNVAYDQTSRLKDLKVNGSLQMDQIAYNDYGQATSIRIGGGASNPLTEQYTFDANTGLMTNQKVKRGSTSLMDLSYYYNRDLSKGSLNGKTGNLTRIVNNLDRNKDRKYEFDTLGRLIKAKGGVAAGGSGVANWTQSYTFDRYGNKKTTVKSGITANSQAVPLDGLASQTYAAATNRITTSGTTYDNAGNQTRAKAPDGSFQKFEYDEAGRIIHIKADNGTVLETNTYGQSRERLKKQAGGTRTYYAWGGSSVLAEYTETSTVPSWAKSYIYAGSRLLSTITKSGSSEVTEYQHPDRLGTKLVTNTSLNTAKENATLPFGTEIIAETQANSNQKFTSYDRSGTTGLDYATNRTYNSGQGRFTQVDPIGMVSTTSEPQSLNLYAYTQNNPVDFVDPKGLDIFGESCIWVNDKRVCSYSGGSDYGGTPSRDNCEKTRTGCSGGGGGGDPDLDKCAKEAAELYGERPKVTESDRREWKDKVIGIELEFKRKLNEELPSIEGIIFTDLLDWAISYRTIALALSTGSLYKASKLVGSKIVKKAGMGIPWLGTAYAIVDIALTVRGSFAKHQAEVNKIVKWRNDNMTLLAEQMATKNTAAKEAWWEHNVASYIHNCIERLKKERKKAKIDATIDKANKEAEIERKAGTKVGPE